MPSEIHWRQGDSAEYFSQYLLSFFGKSVLIPRQEDHGFDFHCTLDTATQSELPLFKESFYLQVKLGDPHPISFGGVTSGNPRRWRKGQITWLFDLDIPLLMGFADTTKHSLTLFQTSSKWLLYYSRINNPLPLAIKFVPNEQINMPTSSRCRIGTSAVGQGNDGLSWRVPMGDPLVTITLDDLENPRSIEKLKYTLSQYVTLERKSKAHQILGTQWGYWISKIDWDQKPFQEAWIIENTEFPEHNSAAFYREFAPYIASLIFRLNAAGQRQAFHRSVALFRSLEKKLALPPELKSELEDVIAKAPQADPPLS